jgi:hypothetical protein
LKERQVIVIYTKPTHHDCSPQGWAMELKKPATDKHSSLFCHTVTGE